MKSSSTEAEIARAQVKACADQLHRQAAEAHSEGLFLARQSARVDQLVEVADDENIVKIRDVFAREGMLDAPAAMAAKVVSKFVGKA